MDDILSWRCRLPLALAGVALSSVSAVIRMHSTQVLQKILNDFIEMPPWLDALSRTASCTVTAACRVEEKRSKNCQ
jgi:hypothetical protein